MSARNTILEATRPGVDASVHASAGTGKTWLLVTRVVRLLLEGANPDSILAVTFTRKAAAEMEQRIVERLQELAFADPQALAEELQQAGIDCGPDTRERAPRLYEELLCNPRRLRCTTFHALCQELLQRFPLEAGVPPGFEVIEKTGQLEQAADDALLAITAHRPDDPVSVALDTLVAGCGGLSNARQALRAFVNQRSDWWAWTQDEPGDERAFAFACKRLAQFLDIDPSADPLAAFPGGPQRAALGEFAGLLANNKTATNLKLADTLACALAADTSGAAFLEAITPVFMTQAGTPRAYQRSKAQTTRLGAEREARYYELLENICNELLALRDSCARHQSCANGSAWYRAGIALLSHYQRIKREQRVFDFADLEWRACDLLNRSEHASWVQYKLDARIDHLLVDEFQDTNPTQWRMLLPLLEELAAGNDERQRSVFVVGDRKQSIYGFRRANPALLATAARWIKDHRNGRSYPLNKSRRSAGAVMECVNAVFSMPSTAALLADFSSHDTHLPDVFGHVELLPLSNHEIEPAGAGETGGELRNPLLAPRVLDEDMRYRHEGELIAAQIQQLMENGATVEKGDAISKLGYGDIMILLRQRTHAEAYEQALRDAGIPCLAASRGLLLENLEVRDLVALLNCLISPYDNLALAQVLRSPLFGLDSEQLLALPGEDGRHWYARLQQLAAEGAAPWRAIHALLAGWRTLAGQLPVHDLLDRIFHEGEVLQRYESAFPATLHPRVRASLTRFIELALELDNGRYPSLPHFLDLLNRLRQSDQDQPDESSPDDSQGDRVRLLTVHAAKGLEAPVVFLADAATRPRDRSAYSAAVNWPDEAARPDIILLAGKAAQRDSRTATLLEQQVTAARCEDANLLYVALTRARQYLFISGSCKPSTRDTGWYGMAAQAMQDCELTASGNPHFHSGTKKPAAPQQDRQTRAVPVPPGLAGAIAPAATSRLIAPSRHSLATQSGHPDSDGRTRGIAIHLMLERLARAGETDEDSVFGHVAAQLERTPDDAELLSCWTEALAVRKHPAFAPLFDSADGQAAYNEVPVQYLEQGNMVHGIIDRLVVNDGDILLIDYKTHQHATPATLDQLAGNYLEQMRYYTRAVTRLWPQHSVRSGLLFTACTELVWLDGLQSAAGTD